MVEIAKTRFVYEVPNPVFRYWLYIVGIADTTILPVDLAHSAKLKMNTFVFPMSILPSIDHKIYQASFSKWPYLKVSGKDLDRYMQRDYSAIDYSRRTCR